MQRVRHTFSLLYSNNTTTVFVVVLLLLLVSCKEEKAKTTHAQIDLSKLPTMTTDSVSLLISDSGITRYKMVTRKWLAFDRAAEPYWFFPQGVYLERFDDAYRMESTVVADSAWNYKNKELWHLKGHVYIKNVKGDEFRTEELFWNQKEDRIYTDKYIEIQRPYTQLKGYGFESNRELTQYQILKPHDGKIPFNEEGSGNTTSPSQMAPSAVTPQTYTP